MPASSSHPYPPGQQASLVLPSGLGASGWKGARGLGAGDSYLVQGRTPGQGDGLGFWSQPPRSPDPWEPLQSLTQRVGPTARPGPGWHLNPPAVPPGGDRDCRVTSGRARKSRLSLWVFAPIPTGNLSVTAPGFSEPGKRTSVGGSSPLV